MDNSQRLFTRIIFQNKVFKANGQAFEDLFTQILIKESDKVVTF